MIKAMWFLPAIALLACEREVPHVDDPNNIIVGGKKMSPDAFINRYCIGKEEDPTCSKVLDAATQNIIDRARGDNKKP